MEREIYGVIHGSTVQDVDFVINTYSCLAVVCCVAENKKENPLP